MAIRKPFKSQYGTYYIEINRKRISLKTRNKEEADNMYKAIKKEYLAGKIVRLSGDCALTLDAYIREYKSWAEPSINENTFRANMLALAKLKDAAGEDVRLDGLSPRHVDMAVKKLRQDKRTTATINNFIRHIKAAMNKAVEWQYIKHNPFGSCRQIKGDKRVPSYLDPDEIQVFTRRLSDLDHDKRRLALAYLLSGRRRSELLRLDWSCIDFDRNRYFINKGKNHLSRWYPMHPLFKALLQAWPGERQGPLITRWKDPSTITHIVKEVLRDTGFGHLRLHDLRHSFASMLAHSGKDLKIIQELLGHTDYRATLIYTHIADNKLETDLADVKFGPMEI